MGPHAELVLEAIKAMIQAKRPLAQVERTDGKPDEIDPAGSILIGDGDPGEAEIDLSPLAYTYSHRIPVSVGARGADPRALLTGLLKDVGEAIEADRALGGLVTWLEAEAPSGDPLEAPGTEVARWADLVLIATYTTRSPLG